LVNYQKLFKRQSGGVKDWIEKNGLSHVEDSPTISGKVVPIVDVMRGGDVKYGKVKKLNWKDLERA